MGACAGRWKHVPFSGGLADGNVIVHWVLAFACGIPAGYSYYGRELAHNTLLG